MPPESRVHYTTPTPPVLPPSERVHVSPELRSATHGLGSIATPGEVAPPTGSRVSGDLLDAAREAARQKATEKRTARLEALKTTLVAGKSRLLYTSLGTPDEPNKYRVEAQKIGKPDEPRVDITDLLQPGSPVVRTKPDGATTWQVQSVQPSSNEDQPERVTLSQAAADGTVRLTGIDLADLLARPTDGRSWRIPIPTE